VAEILLAASAEMAEAAAWYDERVSGLGERFLGEAEAVFARIDKSPLTGAPGVIGVCRMVSGACSCGHSRIRRSTFSSRGSLSLHSRMFADGRDTGRSG